MVEPYERRVVDEDTLVDEAEADVTDEELADYRRYLSGALLTKSEVAMMKAMNL